jgi:hypothetical protein
MAPNQKPSLAARIFQGGGSAGLLGNPMFNIGMGLLAKGQDNRIPYATAVIGGLQDAQAARSAVEQREILRQQQERDARLEALRLQEILEKRQRNELAMQQGQQRTQAFNRAVDARFPNLRPPMMNAGQPDPRAGLLRALGPDAVPAKVLEGLLADGSSKQEEASIQPPSAKDFTAKSIQLFKETGDASVLERLPRYETVKMPDGGVIVVDNNTGQKVENAGITPQDIAARQAEFKKIAKDDPEYVASVSNLLETAKELKKADLSPILGYYDSQTPTFLPSSVDLEADLDLVLANLELFDTDRLKGQGTVTDDERAVLRRATTVLTNRAISEKKAKEALGEIVSLLERKLNPKPGKAVL